jgi:hypothetical protein
LSRIGERCNQENARVHATTRRLSLVCHTTLHGQGKSMQCAGVDPVNERHHSANPTHSARPVCQPLSLSIRLARSPGFRCWLDAPHLPRMTAWPVVTVLLRCAAPNGEIDFPL